MCAHVYMYVRLNTVAATDKCKTKREGEERRAEKIRDDEIEREREDKGNSRPVFLFPSFLFPSFGSSLPRGALYRPRCARVCARPVGSRQHRRARTTTGRPPRASMLRAETALRVARRPRVVHLLAGNRGVTSPSSSVLASFLPRHDHPSSSSPSPLQS